MSVSQLRELMAQGVVYAPGVWDGLTARMAEKEGFGAVCSSGFAIAASMGMPDAELYTMSENLTSLGRIAEATSLPIVADMDTGYGNALNAARTAERFVSAGASAVFMEDQEAPKRCPICVDEPVAVIPLEEAAGKVRAVREAIGDRALLIARTDSTGEDALDRLERYVAEGADLCMPVTKTFSSVEEWKTCHERVGVPMVTAMSAYTWVEREFTPDVLEEIGVGIAFLPTQFTLAVATTLRDVMRRHRAGEPAPQVSQDYMTHKEFIEFIGFPEIEERQAAYLPQPEQV
jgi:methylisocitrate lyase